MWNKIPPTNPKKREERPSTWQGRTRIIKGLFPKNTFHPKSSLSPKPFKSRKSWQPWKSHLEWEENGLEQGFASTWELPKVIRINFSRFPSKYNQKWHKPHPNPSLEHGNGTNPNLSLGWQKSHPNPSLGWLKSHPDPIFFPSQPGKPLGCCTGSVTDDLRLGWGLHHIPGASHGIIGPSWHFNPIIWFISKLWRIIFPFFPFLETKSRLEQERETLKVTPEIFRGLNMEWLLQRFFLG